jgi:5'-nucleotidase
MTNTPLILLVNDDGVFSPGLHATAEAVADLGDLLIAGPATQQTSMGRARPRKPPLGTIEAVTVDVHGEPHPAYAINASPAMVVAHAIIELAPRKPALCISGANYGENVAFSLTGSGTVGAAVEAASFHIPALAVSTETDIHTAHTDDYPPLDWTAVKHFTRQMALQLLERGLPEHVALLNLNLPSDATPETPIRITQLSQTNYYTFLEEQEDRDFTQPFRLMEEKVADKALLEPDSDVMAVIHDRVVSLTPIARNLTAGADFLAAWSLT